MGDGRDCVLYVKCNDAVGWVKFHHTDRQTHKSKTLYPPVSLSLLSLDGYYNEGTLM